MGHKVNPKIFRIGISEEWDSRWFKLGKNYREQLYQDVLIRKYLNKKLKEASLEKIVTERSPDSLIVTIYSSKPGVIIGRGGTGVEEIKKQIEKIIFKGQNKKSRKTKLQLNIKEVSRPQLSAPIVAQNIANELEKRIPYRRAMKRHMESVLKAGALGVKIICSGRLDGIDIARQETQAQGEIPLQTIRANIDYGLSIAYTSTAGTVGVKVWIYKGELFNKKKEPLLNKDNEPKKLKSSN